MDARHLLNFVPRGVNHLILHLGTNDLATAGVSLALTRFNSKAQGINGSFHHLSHQTQNTFFMDHCLDHLPVRLVMAADGVHASFAGVSYLEWNVHRLLQQCRRRGAHMWWDHATSRGPTNDPGLNMAAGPLLDAAPSDDCAHTPLHLRCPDPADLPDPGFGGGLSEFSALQPSAFAPKCFAQSDHEIACGSLANASPPPFEDNPKRPALETGPVGRVNRIPRPTLPPRYSLRDTFGDVVRPQRD
ncbi:hypothetical protein HPB47_015645 [Ixodes persulcatus]|uniref:Uncharacterized protein n=1 Tax=Ixodes persulcatus TaxID=34615 RepID=A0AC60QWJ0_IXOPE|nr:hypothetical protein HPB47_015645 [Ixodes persulcatus]